MGFIDKIISLPTAQTNRRSFKRPSITVTTNDFMYLKPVFSREMMPLQKTDINMSVFSRLAPLVNPAYARCKFVNRCYFVPYRVVFPNFNRMISQEKNQDGVIVTSVPSIMQTDIFEMFNDDLQHGNYFVTIGTESSFDIAYMPYGLGNLIHMKFTKRGKIAFDTLINLGYNIPYVYALTPEMTEEQWNIKFSALPLLCLTKVWFDWYRNNKYEPIINSFYIEKLFNHQSAWNLSVDEIKSALMFVSEVSYPLDYFTAASRNPVTPNIGEPAQSISDPTVPNLGNYRGRVSSSAVNSDSTPITLRQDSMTAPSITDSLIKILNKMTDYLQRDGLVGGKTLDRLLAHYGVRLESEVLRRSVYIGRQEQPITIGDVTQTSATVPDSNQTVLGYQAGRGQTINPSSGHFEYETKEFGQILIVSQVVPEISYYQGVKREMLHINRFDFFTSEYDCLGPQAVARCELYNGPSDVQNSVDYELWYNNFWDGSFGFVPSRYMEYKHSCNQDVLSGDFRCNLSGRLELRHYHQFRQISSRIFDSSSHSIFTNKLFDHIVSDIDQYDRIFANTSDLFDHFISFYDFQVVDFMPCKPAFEGYDFGDDEEHRLRQTVSKNGTMF